MKKFLLDVYARHRARRNPIRFSTSDPKWDKYMHMSMNEFADAINQMPYKPDKLGGLIDRTESFSHFLNAEKKSDRDCDDYARMWSLWGLSNGYKIYEVIVTSKKHFFKDSHVITLLYDGLQFTLCNYRPYRQTAGNMEWLIRTALKEWNPCYKAGMLFALSLVEVPKKNGGSACRS